MAVVTLDVETTTKHKGNVYDEDNKLCSIVIKVISENLENLYSFSSPWDVGLINDLLNKSTKLIGFNIKFDLAWLRREFGFIPNNSVIIHDCQYAEFLFSKQTWRYPDLETSCSNYNLGHKIDVIKEKYWNKGIDTDQIPLEELLEYNKQDVELTYKLYKLQLKKFNKKPQLYKLFGVHMLDLPCLLEMEWNGLLYNKKKSLEQSELLDKQVKDIETKLNLLINFELDWNSNDEKSAILYGGTVERVYKIPIGHYKSGPKTGLTRYKNETQVYTFNRQVEPLKGTEYKKGNVWSVDEPTLRSLKPNKQIKNIINLILERAKLEKLNGTYLKGLPKKLEEKNWGTILHPTYNQCVAVTGRVASSDPNGQNLVPLCKQLIESRF